MGSLKVILCGGGVVSHDDSVFIYLFVLKGITEIVKLTNSAHKNTLCVINVTFIPAMCLRIDQTK